MVGTICPMVHGAHTKKEGTKVLLVHTLGSPELSRTNRELVGCEPSKTLSLSLIVVLSSFRPPSVVYQLCINPIDENGSTVDSVIHTRQQRGRNEKSHCGESAYFASGKSTDLPVLADCRAASRISDTVTLFLREDKLFPS
jgi:hypothetical protein